MVGEPSHGLALIPRRRSLEKCFLKSDNPLLLSMTFPFQPSAAHFQGSGISDPCPPLTFLPGAIPGIRIGWHAVHAVDTWLVVFLS